METKQFVYFVLACQHRNHAEAAAYLGISPSALSESISSLEKTFKLKLFRRGSFGLYPTDGARWLHQTVEPFLRRLEMAERLVGDRKLADISTLIVASPLRYLMGHISRSCSLAARSLAAAFPGVDTEIRFSAPQAADADERAAAIIGRIELDHRPGASGKSSTTVFQDRWVCITQPQGTDGPQRAMTLSLLRAGPIYVPPMPGRMFEQATDYCLKHGFPEPAVFDDDVRTFPRLLQMNSRFCLLAPESLVGESQIRLSFEHRDLPFPLHTRLTATIVEDHPAARQYVKLLKQALQTKTTLSYQPHMTLRQVKHFLTLCADLNITRAARRLNVVQPAVSTQLRNLEKLSAEKLFQRTRSGLKLTPHGEALRRLLQPAEAALDRALLQAPLLAAQSQQRLAVGLFPMLDYSGSLIAAISAALEDWTNRHSEIHLQILEAPTETLHRWVETGRISLALVETQVRRNFQINLSADDDLGLVTGPSSLDLPAGAITFKDAAKLRLILPNEEFGLRQVISQAALKHGIRIAPQMEVNSLSLTLGIIARRPCATILPRHTVTNYVQAGSFQFRPITRPSLKRHLSFLFSTERTLSVLERDLVTTIQHHLAQQKPATKRNQ